MFKNNILEIKRIIDSKNYTNSKFNLVFLLFQSKNILDSSAKIILPFNSYAYNKKSNIEIIEFSINLWYLNNFIDKKLFFGLQNAYFNKPFKNELGVYLNRLLELMLENKNKLNELYLSIDFVNLLLQNIEINEEQNEIGENDLLDIQIYVHDNFEKNISLEHLSEIFHYSPSYFSRLFKEKIGINFSEYLRNIRLNNASLDLLESNLSILEIAEKNGFGSSSSFIRSFKEKFNTTPNKFRENNSILLDRSEKENFLFKNEIKEKYNLNKNNVLNSINSNTILLEAFSPINLVVNVGDINYFYNPNNKNKLINVKDIFKTKFVRFELNIEDLISSEVHIHLSNIIELLYSIELIPYIVLNINSINTNNNIINIMPNLLYFFTKEANKYNQLYLSKWILEFKVDSFHNLNQNKLTFINILSKKLNELVSLENFSLNLGTVNKDFKNYDTVNLNSLNIKFISFEIILGELNNFSDINDTIKDINKIKNKLIKLTNYNYEILISLFEISKSEYFDYNDTVSKGSFLIYLVSHLIGEFKIICLPYFYDIKINNQNNILYGGNGLITYNGLYKSSAYAMLFLRKLGSHIIFKNKGIMVSRKTPSQYVILYSNFIAFSLKSNNNDYISNNLYNFNNKNKLFKTYLNNVKPGTYKIKKYTNNLDSPQLKDILKEIEPIIYLEDDEVQSIQDLCQPKMSLYLKNTNNNTLELETELKVNEFSMLYIYYQF